MMILFREILAYIFRIKIKTTDNLGNFLRRLVLPGKVKHWSLRTLPVKLIKIGAKVLRHSRYVIFQMAEVAIGKEVFAEILSRIIRLGCCPQQRDTFY